MIIDIQDNSLRFGKTNVDNKQANMTFVELSMALVVFVIVAVVAIPTMKFSDKNTYQSASSMDPGQAFQKVQSAFETARGIQGDYPRLSKVVEYLDVDFASELDDMGGIVFWGYKNRVTVKTYNDNNCRNLTSGENPGVSDVVRCVRVGSGVKKGLG